jgi:hypothetical protein
MNMLHSNSHFHASQNGASGTSSKEIADRGIPLYSFWGPLTPLRTVESVILIRVKVTVGHAKMSGFFCHIICVPLLAGRRLSSVENSSESHVKLGKEFFNFCHFTTTYSG